MENCSIFTSRDVGMEDNTPVHVRAQCLLRISSVVGCSSVMMVLAPVVDGYEFSFTDIDESESVASSTPGLPRDAAFACFCCLAAFALRPILVKWKWLVGVVREGTKEKKCDRPSRPQVARDWFENGLNRAV